MKEVFTPSCRLGWRALAAFLRKCNRMRVLHEPAALGLHCGASVLCRTRESCMHPPHFWPLGGRPVSRLVWRKHYTCGGGHPGAVEGLVLACEGSLTCESSTGRAPGSPRVRSGGKGGHGGWGGWAEGLGGVGGGGGGRWWCGNVVQFGLGFGRKDLDSSIGASYGARDSHGGVGAMGRAR
jgi:hypothetical protein